MHELNVTVDGLSFRIRIEGHDGAPWVVFSNSLLTNLSMWDDTAGRLRDRYRVLRYDQRGHGGTEVPPGPATIERLGEDMAEILCHFDVRGAVLVGISMGFATALVAADLVPERVSGLVLADGAIIAPDSAASVWQERIALAEAHGMEALVEPTVARWFRPGFLEQGAPVEAVREMIRATPLGGYAACTHALSGYDLRAAMARVKVPVALLSGEHDGNLPQVLPALAAGMSNARYIEIAGAGHIPAIEQPERFGAVLEEFLARL